MLKSFIPRYIPNVVVVWVLHILSWFSGLSGKRSSGNLNYNRVQLLDKNSMNAENNTYIENQSMWTGVLFGSVYKLSYSGCEVIAVYNALLSLGQKMSVKELMALITAFEKKGIVGRGKFGVSPRAAYLFFKRAGYRVTMTASKKASVINEIGACSDTTIVTVYNDRNDITKQVHTMNVSKDDAGKYHIHNGYKVRTDAGGKRQFVDDGPYDTLEEAIKGMARGNAGVISVIGIIGSRL